MKLKQWYNNATKNWRAAPNPDGAQFGCIDVKEMKFHAGYMTKGGEMKYEKRGSKTDPWGEIEFLENREGSCWRIDSPWFGDTTTIELPVVKTIYRQRHIFTNEYRYFMGSPTDREYIDKIAYEASGTVVEL